MSEDPWYAERRARWKPDRVVLLLIAESAPDDGGDETNRRFFYEERLTGHDGLFREVVKALYAPESLKSGPEAKRPWLQRLKDDGVFLVDLPPIPVNYQDPEERDAMLRSNLVATVDLARSLQPQGIVLVKQNVFELLAEALKAAGLHVLHQTALPFPASGWQKVFRERFQQATTNLGLRPEHSEGGMPCR